MTIYCVFLLQLFCADLCSIEVVDDYFLIHSYTTSNEAELIELQGIYKITANDPMHGCKLIEDTPA